MYSIALFGGTFDPVHNGHIQTSLTIQHQFHFDSYRFIPCKVPTIKPAAIANNEQRIAMLELAINKHGFCDIDLREIKRETPSYMVETLESIRQEHPEASLTLVLGYDAFLSLPKWHQWENIIKLAHLLVINRDAFNIQPSDLMKEFLHKYKTKDKECLKNKHSGTIYEFNAGDYPISSTEIKSELKKHSNVSTQLPIEVYDYIKQQGLYL